MIHVLEQRFIVWALPYVPKWAETYHLTLASVPICLLLILFAFLATDDIRWLWGMSAMIALQWLTDSLDGSVGRVRNTGLIRWGYYMDHLLDYFFLAALMIGYMILLPDKSKWMFFFVFALFAGFMVHSYLSMAATNKFRVSHFGIGPTEIRLVFILINTLLILFGKTHLVFALPFVLGFAFVGMIFMIYREQRAIWAMDMARKRNVLVKILDEVK